MSKRIRYGVPCLNETEKLIIKTLKKNKEMSAFDISGRIGLSYNYTLMVLRNLIRKNIVRRGKGVYELNDELACQ